MAKRAREAEYTCAVCLAEHPLERTDGKWKHMSCTASHGPCICEGDCFNGWVETNPSCPVCRESWKEELPNGVYLAEARKINSAFDAELAAIDSDERDAFARLQRGDDRMYQRRDFIMERMVVTERKYRALASMKRDLERRGRSGARPRRPRRRARGGSGDGGAARSAFEVRRVEAILGVLQSRTRSGGEARETIIIF
jgi:hypothetical protein